MRDITATDAARRFSDVLDAVEHEDESFVVVRHGRAVARIVPTGAANGRAVKDLLLRTPPDARWADDLAAIRAAITEDRRSWRD